MQNLKKIAVIKGKYGNGKYKGKYIVKFDYITSYKIIFSWYKVEKLDKNFSRSKISKIPGIWRHFQEFRKFQEFDVISKNWQNSRKNFSNDLLQTYVLLIQSRIFGQKFQSIENFENSRNLTSFPRIGEILGKISRTTSCQLMFSWYKVEFSAKNFSRSKISIIPGIWRHFQEFRKFQEFDVISKNWRNSRKNFSSDLLSTYVLLIQSRIFGQNFSRSKISIITGIWRHFQEFRKFQEFDVISKNWRNSWKNFSSDLLPTYVLLIQSRIFGQKFQSIENFDNSRNLTSFPRIGEIPGKISLPLPLVNLYSPDTKSNFRLANF